MSSAAPGVTAPSSIAIRALRLIAELSGLVLAASYMFAWSFWASFLSYFSVNFEETGLSVAVLAAESLIMALPIIFLVIAIVLIEQLRAFWTSATVQTVRAVVMTAVLVIAIYIAALGVEGEIARTETRALTTVELFALFFALNFYFWWRSAPSTWKLVVTVASTALFLGAAVVGSTALGRDTAAAIYDGGSPAPANLVGMTFTRFPRVAISAPGGSDYAFLDGQCGVLIGVTATQNIIALSGGSGGLQVWRISSELAALKSGCS